MRGKQAAATAGGIASLIAAIIAVEGGYVNHPDDPGGATKYGITERQARACGYQGDMRKLPLDTAADCYVRFYVDKPGYRAFVEMDPAFGKEIVDSGVNVGPHRTSTWIQESLNHYNRGGRDYPDIAEDGRIGPGTMAAYHALRERRGPEVACRLMITAVDAKQAQHYMRLAARNPKFESFMPGWMSHRVNNVDLGECGEG